MHKQVLNILEAARTNGLLCTFSYRVSDGIIKLYKLPHNSRQKGLFTCVKS